jgi:hypothetical protein
MLFGANRGGDGSLFAGELPQIKGNGIYPSIDISLCGA